MLEENKQDEYEETEDNAGDLIDLGNDYKGINSAPKRMTASIKVEKTSLLSKASS